MQVLTNHPWPGNLRELGHVIERAVLMSQADALRAADLGLQAPRETAPQLDDMSMEDVERFLIKKTLARFDGNARKAAESLGLSRSAFYRRLEKYGL
jgi:DNA-binding NtrC family response regulator